MVFQNGFPIEFSDRFSKEFIMSKKKNKNLLIRMVSSAGTGHFYITRRSPKAASKLELMKYDPVKRARVTYKEAKDR